MTVPKTRNRTTWPTDVTALLARIAIGAVFIAHGWQKVAGGLDGTAQGFEGLGIPLPQVAAVTAVVIEVGAGAALMAGLLLPVAGILLAAMMAMAYYFVHVGDPLLGGYELLLVLGAGALALGFSGGNLTLDRFLPWGSGTWRHEPASARA